MESFRYAFMNDAKLEASWSKKASISKAKVSSHDPILSQKFQYYAV